MAGGSRLDPLLQARWLIPGVTLLVALPLLVALADLRSQHWYPVLDLAMTELRVRDVGGGHTPLIGLPGRIGSVYQEQGSHPGPLSFYLVAPVYRLLGSTAWALQAAAVAVHVAAIATALWIGHRRAGWRGVVAVGALMAVAVRGYGQILLTQPWNPYLPLLAWMVVLLAAWSVLCGDRWMLVPMVLAGSLAAQTHVPYLLPAGVLTLAAIGYSIWSLGHRCSNGRRRWADRPTAVAVALGILLWVPPVIDQLVNDPGNVRKLIDHFGTPPESVLGFGEGLRLAGRHLDVWAGFVDFAEVSGVLAGSGRFLGPAVAWRGVVAVAVWAIVATAAWRRSPVTLRALHKVIAAALVLGLISMARIFGLPWFYLTLWAWTTTILMVGATVWSLVALSSRIDALTEARRQAMPLIGGAVLAVVTLASTIAFADAHVPEPRLSRAVEAVAEPTYEAVVSGVGAATGPDGRYQVRWSDAADIGSPGFGLLNDLERRGLDLAADEFFTVQVTDHRVRSRSASDAQIHLATGAYVDIWRGAPGAVEVATFEPRSPAEVTLYNHVRQRLIDRLRTEGLDDLVGLIDTNLFGASLAAEISQADRDDITLLLELGQPVSVFIAPADADPVG